MQLLKEFLESGLTQTEFAKRKGITQNKMSKELMKLRWQLLDCQLFDVEAYINPYASELFHVKRNTASWLKAIEMFEKATAGEKTIAHLMIDWHQEQMQMVASHGMAEVHQKSINKLKEFLPVISAENN